MRDVNKRLVAQERRRSAPTPWDKIPNKPTEFPPSPHTHSATNITSGELGDARLPARIRGAAQLITDWDYARTNGFYVGNGAANAPEATGWFLGYVEARNTLWVTQTVHAFDAADEGPADTRMYRRDRNNGEWQAWYRLRPSEEEQALLWAAKDHQHAATDITSGTLSVARGGTGQTTVAGVKSAFGITAAENRLAELEGRKYASGTISTQANAYTTVTLSAGLFSSTPHVVASNGSQSAVGISRIVNTTRTSFQIGIWGLSGQRIAGSGVDWIATGPGINWITP